MTIIRGRGTIRKAGPGGVNPLQPSRENRRIRPWDLEAKPNTTAARLLKHYLGALDAVDAVTAHKAEAAKSGRFTDAGLGDEMLGFVRTGAVATLKRGRDAITAARREVAAQREKVKLQPVDKMDVVGFLRRQEMRQHLRAMTNDDRNAYVARHKSDADLALAIVELPAEFSGALDADRTQLIDRALEAQWGGALAELRELEQAIAIAETAIAAADSEVIAEIGPVSKGLDAWGKPILAPLTAAEFSERVADAEQRVGAPWLRKFSENGADVVRRFEYRPGTNGAWVDATDDDLSVGVFYENSEAFQRENPDWAA
jgi:hypothetical protein